MDKVFISYKFTGEDSEKLKKVIPQLHDIIEEKGYSHYSTIFDSRQFHDEKWSGKDIMNKAFSEIDESDLILFFVNSSEVSKGMLVELGYALAKNKKLLLTIREDIKESIFRRQIPEVIEFKDLEDLKEKLSDYEF